MTEAAAMSHEPRCYQSKLNGIHSSSGGNADVYASSHLESQKENIIESVNLKHLPEKTRTEVREMLVPLAKM